MRIFRFFTYSDLGHSISFVLMWPMYTSMNLFTGCFLLNGIVQYILVVYPNIMPESWNDKLIAWGLTSLMGVSLITASALMHCYNIVPPSYHSMRGMDHDLTDHVAIILRRVMIITSFAIICTLRVKISFRPKITLSMLYRKLRCFYKCCNSRNTRDDVRIIDDTVQIFQAPNSQLGNETTDTISQPSNQVFSNGTLFIWSLLWLAGMYLRWDYGDANLLIGDLCSISIFYVYPIIIVLTNYNTKLFVKRRLDCLYHRFVHDINNIRTLTRYLCSAGCLRRSSEEDNLFGLPKSNTQHDGQWAIRTTRANNELIEIKEVYGHENRSFENHKTDQIVNSSVVVLSVE